MVRCRISRQDPIFEQSSMNRLHIEPTNRCILECPACPRTQWKELLKSPVPKADLDLVAFESFLDCDGGREIQRFDLCGDYGDPIYYPQLFEFLEKFRSSRSFHITTNGSRKNKEFWQRLSSILDKQDQITFSIDGLEDTNHLYRINSDWPSIMLGLDTMLAGRANVQWKTIIFAYNYQQLDQIKKIAESKGATFTAVKTHRFGKDWLIPPEHLVENEFLYRLEYSNPDNKLLISPRCNQEKTVTCDGYLFPCDWIRNPRTLYKSELWKHRSRWLEKLHIRNTNFDEAMKVVNDWANHVRENSVKGQTVPDLCKMKCRQGCESNTAVEIS